ncbi:MAG: DUF881 domain-containing protein [Nocardioides sp.]
MGGRGGRRRTVRAVGGDGSCADLAPRRGRRHQPGRPDRPDPRAPVRHEPQPDSDRTAPGPDDRARQPRDRAGGLLQTALAQAQRIRLGAGYAAVRGPGLRLTVDDSPSGLDEEAVQARDLALLVNALWGSGAEAIAINGRRLTPLTSIRNSNRAINVNSQPLAPPYVVEAIGDPDSLPRDFVNSFEGQRFFALADAVHFKVQSASVGTLRLPAGPGPRLRYLGAGGAVDNGGGRAQEGGTP